MDTNGRICIRNMYSDITEKLGIIYCIDSLMYICVRNMCSDITEKLGIKVALDIEVVMDIYELCIYMIKYV